METRSDKMSRAREANWPAVLFYIHVHLLSIYGLWLLFVEAKILTIMFLITLVAFANLGITTGAHRLWAHYTYTASKELKIALMIFQTLAGVGSIYDWVQHHRLHHATFKTDNDPHDCRKGFLYAHLLTRMQKLSPQQEAIKQTINMSDLENDSVVMFQKKFYWVLYALVFVIAPLVAPVEYWGESELTALFVIGFLRYALVLHAAWLAESGVSVWRLKEGEKYPPDSNTVFILNRSSWPEYHYIYPHDYKSGEYGTYGSGCSTAFIRVYAALGLATKLNTLQTRTLQLALAEKVKTNKPLLQCITEGVNRQNLPEDHYLKN
ncbi:acyl-CoA Delta-9 desaturase [Aricia agestis]|uniref:acyl-CoA Delta-9 desaturase n=1 Tax=Aricia agestis TaxID=91739 RepID=UPI001C2083C6|nr:acyl-CoA Delta-9 desaturase [Aricia agestis]XP_041984728.1 acyl-CoA Delta-9 desaturase [Aricia agestis]XP_041984735.1 acyl-CoA Delta-9 desaturase [Aricia agestis]